MADLPADVRRHGEMALDAIEHVQGDGLARPKKQFAAAMEHLVAMRDALIRAQRQGEPCDDDLRGTNAILSSIFGIEFPSGGLQWKRVTETHDALLRLLDGHPPA
ncbi:MAG: hypothetical protein P8Y71_15925 [Pseudolabrys sp.]